MPLAALFEALQQGESRCHGTEAAPQLLVYEIEERVHLIDDSVERNAVLVLSEVGLKSALLRAIGQRAMPRCIMRCARSISARSPNANGTGLGFTSRTTTSRAASGGGAGAPRQHRRPLPPALFQIDQPFSAGDLVVAVDSRKLDETCAAKALRELEADGRVYRNPDGPGWYPRPPDGDASLCHLVSG
jgi:hypothetical protein